MTCRCLTQKLCDDKSITNAFGGSGSPPPFSTNHSFYLLRKDCCTEQKQDYHSVTSHRIKDEKLFALKDRTAVCLKRHDPRKQKRFIECSLKPTKYIEIHIHVMGNCAAFNCCVPLSQSRTRFVKKKSFFQIIKKNGLLLYTIVIR